MLDMYKGMINSPETTITNDINAVDTIIYVLDETKVPEELPNLMTLGTGTSAETVKVLEVNGNALTVERGFQGTPRSWNAGTIIARNFTEYDYNALVENIKTLKGNTDTNADDILSLMNYVGNLENLDTVEKSNIVLALNEIYQDLVAHKAESIHQGKNNTLEATSTNDATSVTNAPLKSAGGLAVAKSAYIGGSPLSLVLGKGNYIRKYILNANADIPDIPKQLEVGKQLRITFTTSYFEGFCLDIMYFNRYASYNYEFCEKIFTGINGDNEIRGLNAVNKVGIVIPDENIIIDHQGSGYRFDLIIKPSRTSHGDNQWSVVIDSYGFTDILGAHSPIIVSIIYEDIQIEEE